MKEVIEDEEKQSLFEKMMMAARNTPKQLLTLEYIHNKGIKLYSDAVVLSENNKSELVTKKKFIQAIKYLQAAMILGNSEACFVISDFYRKDYLNLVIPGAANLTNIIGCKLLNVTVPEVGRCDNYEILEELASRKVEFINKTKSTWANPPASHLRKETYYLKPLIEKFNNDLPENCKLISNARTCKELDNAIDDFTMIELTNLGEDKNIIEATGNINIKDNDPENCCFWS